MKKGTLKVSGGTYKSTTTMAKNSDTEIRQRNLLGNSPSANSEMNFDNYSTKDNNSFHSIRHGNVPSLREYAQNLELWLWQYKMWNSMNSLFPFYFMSNSLNQSFSSSYSSHNTPNAYQQPGQMYNQQATPPQPMQQPRQPATVRTNLTGTEYVIPPLWKRVVAELLDFVVLFYLKVMLTVVVMRQLGYLKNDSMLDVKLDLLPILDFNEITEVDFEKAFSLTSEIIALEIINRIFITLFETLCLRRGPRGTIGGATPGKRVFGLKVVSCEEIVDLRNGKLLVIPAQNIGFLSALVRSVIKNFTMAFFFPACFTVFFFQHNRTAYDVLAKTIVVQNPEEQQR